MPPHITEPRQMEASRPTSPCPQRATDTRVEGPLRGPLRSGGHHQRVRPRTRHAPLPLPRTARNSLATRTHGYRREHRTPQRPGTSRGSPFSTAADRFPDLPGPPRDPPVEVLADPRHLISTPKIPDRVRPGLQGLHQSTATPTSRPNQGWTRRSAPAQHRAVFLVITSAVEPPSVNPPPCSRLSTNRIQSVPATTEQGQRKEETIDRRPRSTHNPHDFGKRF